MKNLSGKKKRFWVLVCVAAAAAAMLLGGCGSKNKVKLIRITRLPLQSGIIITGPSRRPLIPLVKEFNDTVGMKEGIFVKSTGKGDVNQLEESVRSALKKEVGSDEAPDIFSSYADTAYEIQQMGYLADLSSYLTEDEISEYVDSYVEEGRIGKGNQLFIFPTAKSSEILMLDKTDWDKFAAATGAELSSLSTMEGLAETAKEYYEWTDSLTPAVENDGKAFTAGMPWRIYLLSVPCSWGLRFSRLRISRLRFR